MPVDRDQNHEWNKSTRIILHTYIHICYFLMDLDLHLSELDKTHQSFRLSYSILFIRNMSGTAENFEF